MFIFVDRFWRTIFIVLLWCVSSNVNAELNGKFSVAINGVQDSELLTNVRNAVDLIRRAQQSNKKTLIPDFELNRLVNSASAQALNALKPYGYYRAEANLTNPQPKNYVLTIALGPATVISHVQVDLNGSATQQSEFRTWQNSFPLRQDQRLIQPKYDEAKDELGRLFRRYGYFDYQFTASKIVVQPDFSSASITLSAESGKRYTFGGFAIKWPDELGKAPYEDGLVKRYLPDTELNKPYDALKLQEIQRTMSGSGFFKSVRIEPMPKEAEEDGRVPVELKLDVPKRYQFGGRIGFGTDSGVRAGLDYQDRRFNQRGHQINASLQASQIDRSISSSYSIPKYSDPRDSVSIFGSFIDEQSDNRDFSTLSTGIDFNYSLGPRSQFSYGLSYRDETFNEEGEEFSTQLLLPSLSWQTIWADDLKSPTKGYRVSATVRGGSEDAGSDISLLQVNLDAKSVYQFAPELGRILTRVELGQTWVDEDDVLPTSLRYLTGGDNTVRGYDFETIGVNQIGEQVTGGENTVNMSVEYEYPLRGALSVAAFVDAGDAFDDKLKLKTGVGVGVRWRLPFGAIRFDLAQAQDLDGKPTRFHFTFGTDL